MINENVEGEIMERPQPDAYSLLRESVHRSLVQENIDAIQAAVATSRDQLSPAERFMLGAEMAGPWADLVMEDDDLASGVGQMAIELMTEAATTARTQPEEWQSFLTIIHEPLSVLGNRAGNADALVDQDWYEQFVEENLGLKEYNPNVGLGAQDARKIVEDNWGNGRE